MYIEEFRHQQFLPRPIEEIFTFFADAANLQKLTPAFLRFRILTPLPIVLKVGTLIDYRLKIHTLPIRWRTQITEWNPPHSFRDIQLKGPYRLWDHFHQFEPAPGGTNVIDHVRYAALGGRLTHRLLVNRDIRNIFAYRAQILDELFPAPAK
jgi:ligand-binding SRPBCC domain-containing protein